MSFRPTFQDPRTKEGELLWPARMGEDAVAKLEEFLGTIGTAGQLQQRPIPRGGGIVKREDFRFYRRNDIQLTEHFQWELQALSVDAAFKDTKASSYVVIQAWARRGALNYLLAQKRERLTFTNTIKALRVMRADHPNANAVLIEDKANGPAIIDVLKDEIPGIIPIEPIGSKEARAEAAAPLINAGNVLLPHPDEAPWVEGFISEWLSVPTGAFWDQVDASGQYLLKYGRFYMINMDMQGAVSESSVVDAGGNPGWHY